jgi:hypothetical protein
MQSSLPNYDLSKLRQWFVSRFNIEEMQTLCFDLDVDYECISGQNKSGFAREIILYFQRRNQLTTLINYCSKVRPDFPLQAIKRVEAIPPSNLITVVCGDITDFACDVAVLKYAQAFYGADQAVALKVSNYPQHIKPAPGAFIRIPTEGKIAARQVLFVGVPDLWKFDYEQIRVFSSASLKILAQQMPSARTVAMTMHGVNYGLDERESFFSQVIGIMDAVKSRDIPPSLSQITIVEQNEERAARLQSLLDENVSNINSINEGGARSVQSQLSLGETAPENRSTSKPHVFVAMPFSENMDDTYVFGIQAPINAAGYLCERVDMVTFTGDILERIKNRIETASLVVADLTTANPNVYLEVGYAWGKRRPTLLIARQGDELKFDVKGQRCVFYKNIVDLSRKLESDLKSLV